jgi:hypothetical protein
MGKSQSVKEKDQSMKDGIAYCPFVYFHRDSLVLDPEMTRPVEYISMRSIVSIPEPAMILKSREIATSRLSFAKNSTFD